MLLVGALRSLIVGGAAWLMNAPIVAAVVWMARTLLGLAVLSWWVVAAFRRLQLCVASTSSLCSR